ncbi:hypothetical protein CHARACLAT_013428 [Characodon lateralis]|uniref:Uncharacterized protein n=1 Tax=Characodon lateralis TaxID=208331 RepID=A0ABU7DIR4_9TELE|nr:hypothetical protein [Characodon lateralis]
MSLKESSSSPRKSSMVRLLDFSRIPLIILHRIDHPQNYAYKWDEVLTDQQLCNQKRNSSLDQQEPQPVQMKEDQDEVEHLRIKEEQEVMEHPQTKKGERET